MTDVARPNSAAGISSLRFHTVVAVAGIAFGFTAPLTAVYAIALGVGAALAGLAVSSANASVLIVDIIGTRWTPRLDARKAVTAGLLIFGLGSLATGLSNDFVTMVAARLFQGVGVALFLGVGPQLALRLAHPQRAGRALGGFHAAWFAGIALGPTLGGWTAQLAPGADGFRLAFLVCGVLSALIAVLVWTTFPGTPSSRRPQFGLPNLARISPRAYWVLLSGGLGQGVRSGLQMTLIPLFGSQVLGLSTVHLGIALSFFAVADVLAMSLASRLSDHLGRFPVMLGACLWGVTATIALLKVDGVVWFTVACVAIGISVGVTWVVPGAMAVDVIDDPETALATYRIAADSGMVAGGIAMGTVISVIGARGAVVVAVMHISITALLVTAIGETRRRAPHGAVSAVPSADVPAEVPIDTAVGTFTVSRDVRITTPSGGTPMSIDEPRPAGPLPDAALFDALLADQGLTFLSAARREKALADHLALRPSLLRLRAAVPPFVEGAEPATAVAFLETYDLEAIR